LLVGFSGWGCAIGVFVLAAAAAVDALVADGVVSGLVAGTIGTMARVRD
jgi:Gpi18-like mannosyltransferase